MKRASLSILSLILILTCNIYAETMDNQNKKIAVHYKPPKVNYFPQKNYQWQSNLVKVYQTLKNAESRERKSSANKGFRQFIPFLYQKLSYGPRESVFSNDRMDRIDCIIYRV